MRAHATKWWAVLALQACVGASAVARPAEPVVELDVLDGAPYRIDIPAEWNRELVIFAHGYRLAHDAAPAKMPREAVAQVLLARGYAVAASGYRAQGWAVAEASADTEALRVHFAKQHRKPKRTYIVGQSMGAQVALAAIEAPKSEYDGALLLCGVLTPASTFFEDRVFAAMATMEFYFPGFAHPDGFASPDAPDSVKDFVFEQALAGKPTEAFFLSRRMNIQHPDLAPTLALYYSMYRDLRRRAGGNPFDNRATIYTGTGDDLSFNRGVVRMAAEPAATAYVQRHYTPTGSSRVPMLALHTVYDPVVPPESVGDLQRRARMAGAGDRLAVRYVGSNGHCRFDGNQINAAFGELVNWVGSKQAPASGELR
jgi:pimeloyl-ACP methyl ester carboxylesterase